MDMIAADDSASQVSDKIKDILYAKSAERVDGYKPNVANSLFGDQESADEIEAEVDKAAAITLAVSVDTVSEEPLPTGL